MEFFTRAIRKNAPEYFERLVERGSGCERTHKTSILYFVFCIFGNPSLNTRYWIRNTRLVGYKNSWKFIACKSNVKIIFVVPHKDVEFWPVALDELRFFDERLYIRRKLDPFEFCCFLPKRFNFLPYVFPEIRRKPLFQIFGFADVDRCFPASEYIHARCIRRFFREFQN